MVLRDPSLTHQVVLFFEQGKVAVSCNCRRQKHSTNGVESHASMGFSSNIGESRVLYNNPRNHDKPFGPEDKALW